jgi:hypothetical protein
MACLGMPMTGVGARRDSLVPSGYVTRAWNDSDVDAARGVTELYGIRVIIRVIYPGHLSESPIQ